MNFWTRKFIRNNTNYWIVNRFQISFTIFCLFASFLVCFKTWRTEVFIFTKDPRCGITPILIKHHFVRIPLAFNRRVEDDDNRFFDRIQNGYHGTSWFSCFFSNYLDNLHRSYLTFTLLLCSVSNFLANCTILDKYFLLLLDFDNIPALIESNHLGDWSPEKDCSWRLSWLPVFANKSNRFRKVNVASSSWWFSRFLSFIAIFSLYHHYLGFCWVFDTFFQAFLDSRLCVGRIFGSSWNK